MVVVGGFGAVGVVVVGNLGAVGVGVLVGVLIGVNAPTTAFTPEFTSEPAIAAEAASVATSANLLPVDVPLELLDVLFVMGANAAVPDPGEVIEFAGAVGAITDVVSPDDGTVVGAVDVWSLGDETTLVKLRLGFKYSVFRFFCKFAMSAIFFFQTVSGNSVCFVCFFTAVKAPTGAVGMFVVGKVIG